MNKLRRKSIKFFGTKFLQDFKIHLAKFARMVYDNITRCKAAATTK